MVCFNIWYNKCPNYYFFSQLFLGTSLAFSLSKDFQHQLVQFHKNSYRDRDRDGGEFIVKFEEIWHLYNIECFHPGLWWCFSIYSGLLLCPTDKFLLFFSHRSWIFLSRLIPWYFISFVFIVNEPGWFLVLFFHHNRILWTWLLIEGGCVPPPTGQIRRSIAEVGSLSLVGNPWVLTRLIWNMVILLISLLIVPPLPCLCIYFFWTQGYFGSFFLS